MKIHHRGFTLTEILLVSCMFAVISLAVFNAFSNGFKLWARGEHVMVEGDTAIFLDRFAEDLRQTVTITGIAFKGSSEEISFPAIIIAPTDIHGTRAREEVGSQIGAISYSYDPAEKKIYRRQATYGQALKSQWSYPLEVAKEIEGVSFHYYFKGDRGLDLKSETEEGVPLGVMIDIEFLDEGQECHMTRFLIIPVGGGL